MYQKNRHIAFATGLTLVVLLCGCSTQKNTPATRSFHQTKVKYNIMYNGNTAYEEGLKAIRDANEDDYSAILNLYPVSNHQAAEAATSQMDKTIEKCRKCIKLHSIKAKPKPDPKKRNDPKYKLWLQQEEFNNQMGEAWLRLGEAEFHKGDFLGSIGTFTYISRHYSTDPDMVARCQLWIARAYGELGWLYEAEDMLHKVQIDALSKKHARLYSAVSADILLKTKQYHAAIPFVKIAIPYEKRKVYRPRFQIEFLFRDAKQFTGLTHCQARDEKALDFAFNLSLSAVNVAKEVCRRQNLNLSIADFKSLIHNTMMIERFLSMFGRIPNINKNQRLKEHYVKELMLYGLKTTI